jgi:hypothetical protein
LYLVQKLYPSLSSGMMQRYCFGCIGWSGFIGWIGCIGCIGCKTSSITPTTTTNSTLLYRSTGHKALLRFGVVQVIEHDAEIGCGVDKEAVLKINTYMVYRTAP